MRVVYLGGKSSGAANLRVLLEQRSALGFDVSAVGASQRDGGIKDIASAYGVPTISNPDAIPECDLLLSVQYDQILLKRHIAKARSIAVNLHFAPLPEYRGCNQFSLAILDRRTEFGVTLHEIDEGIDSGAILFESRFSIPEEVWVEELHALTLKKAEELFATSLPQLLAGQFTPRPQADLIAKRGEPRLSYRKEINALKEVDLSQPADEIARRIRATAMPGFTPPYAVVNGERVYLTRNPNQENP